MNNNSNVTFRDLNLSEPMLVALSRKNFLQPSPVQEKVIPILLTSSSHIIAQAQTGTGKTAAFGIPLVEKLDSSLHYTQAIILTPTRELCLQVCEEITSLKTEKNLNIVPIYGGQSISLQISKLKKNPHIIVGTPGRVIDHLERGSLKIEKIRFFILDEADEMFSMGFQEDVETIMKFSSESSPQILLFSATFPKMVKNLVKKYIPVHEQVSITPEQVTTDLVVQKYYMVSPSQKFQALTRILDTVDQFYGIIFCQTKIGVQEVVNKLIEKGYKAGDIHGDLSQAQREATLKKFKKHSINILVATDVAARGIDVQDLTHVINYNLPQDPEAYVHRIGRTGRAGKQGVALSLVSRSDYGQLLQIKRIAKVEIEKANLPSTEELITHRSQRLLDEIEKLSSHTPKKEDLFYVDNLAGDLLSLSPENPKNIISLLLQHFGKDLLLPSYYGEIEEERSAHHDNNSQRIFIALGKSTGATKESIHNLLLERGEIKSNEIEDILVLENFSFASLPSFYAHALVREEKKHAGFKRKPLITLAKERDSKPSFSRSSRGGGYKNDRGSSFSHDRNDRNSSFSRDKGDRNDRGSSSFSRDSSNRGGGKRPPRSKSYSHFS